MFEKPQFETPSLEAQFDNPERWELEGGVVQVHDVMPERLKTDIPVVFAPGWAATPTSFRENILAFAGLGRRIISVDSVHGIEAEGVEDHSKTELRKTAALVQALEAKGIEQVDLVGHSEAGIYATIAASLYPGRFRNLVLIEPGGMVGEDTVKRLLLGSIKDLAKQVADSVKNRKSKAPLTRAFGEASKAIMKNPVEAARQIVAINKAQIQDRLKALKAAGHGIAIIHGVDDTFFPMDKIQKTVSSEMVDGFYSVKGTHNEFYMQPQKYTALADQALDALEKKKNSHQG
jgi:pimeloyl-ACP methyl ester carboxylesterase